jgi:hypothetical protein
MYPFLREAISQIAASNDQLIGRSRDAVRKAQMMLASPCPDVFLGRQRHDLIPLPYELEE